jgi:hypothetical protein
VACRSAILTDEREAAQSPLVGVDARDLRSERTSMTGLAYADPYERGLEERRRSFRKAANEPTNRQQRLANSDSRQICRETPSSVVRRL